MCCDKLVNINNVRILLDFQISISYSVRIESDNLVRNKMKGSLIWSNIVEGMSRPWRVPQKGCRLLKYCQFPGIHKKMFICHLWIVHQQISFDNKFQSKILNIFHSSSFLVRSTKATLVGGYLSRKPLSTYKK